MSCEPSMNEQTLDQLQRAAFGYFLQVVNPANGLIADTSREGSPCSIGVVGFALSAYPVAVECGWMARADAVARSLAALRFFRDSDQSGSPEATGFKGFYYHFLDMHMGARVWRSELSTIDTAFLIAGALTASRYFTSNTPEETELCKLVEALYLRVDWRWSQGGAATIRQGWKPECGFLHYGWDGYNESIILYVLALGSPTHPLTKDSYQAWTATYQAWTATYQWKNLYGYDFLYAGPLFIQDAHDRERLDNVHPAGWRNPQPADRYNLVVIGAGTAGLVAAHAAAALGAKIALIERNLLGGDCLNVGCVPSKAIIRMARLYADMRNARQYGAQTPDELRVDFAAVMQRMRGIRARISRADSVHRLMRAAWMCSSARCVSPEPIH